MFKLIDSEVKIVTDLMTKTMKKTTKKKLPVTKMLMGNYEFSVILYKNNTEMWTLSNKDRPLISISIQSPTIEEFNEGNQQSKYKILNTDAKSIYDAKAIKTFLSNTAEYRSKFYNVWYDSVNQKLFIGLSPYK